MTDTTFPAIGHDWSADYGEMKFHLRFDADGSSMTFVDAGAADFSTGETVQYVATELRPNLWRVVWQEKSGVTVSQVEHFERGEVYAAITVPEGPFLDLKGRWAAL